jgi:hypothetical protein
MDGGRRMWSALCGFEPLPHEIIDASAIKGADRGVMKLVGLPAADADLFSCYVYLGCCTPAWAVLGVCGC